MKLRKELVEQLWDLSPHKEGDEVVVRVKDGYYVLMQVSGVRVSVLGETSSLSFLMRDEICIRNGWYGISDLFTVEQFKLQEF